MWGVVWRVSRKLAEAAAGKSRSAEVTKQVYLDVEVEPRRRDAIIAKTSSTRYCYRSRGKNDDDKHARRTPDSATTFGPPAMGVVVSWRAAHASAAVAARPSVHFAGLRLLSGQPRVRIRVRGGRGRRGGGGRPDGGHGGRSDGSSGQQFDSRRAAGAAQAAGAAAHWHKERADGAHTAHAAQACPRAPHPRYAGEAGGRDAVVHAADGQRLRARRRAHDQHDDQGAAAREQNRGMRQEREERGT